MHLNKGLQKYILSYNEFFKTIKYQQFRSLLIMYIIHTEPLSGLSPLLAKCSPILLMYEISHQVLGNAMYSKMNHNHNSYLQDHLAMNEKWSINSKFALHTAPIFIYIHTTQQCPLYQSNFPALEHSNIFFSSDFLLLINGSLQFFCFLILFCCFEATISFVPIKF